MTLSAQVWTDIAEVADMILRGSGAVYYGVGGRPMAGTARGAAGAACSSPVVREDNDTQDNRYRDERGQPVHHTKASHSGTVARRWDGGSYSFGRLAPVKTLRSNSGRIYSLLELSRR